MVVGVGGWSKMVVVVVVEAAEEAVAELLLRQRTPNHHRGHRHPSRQSAGRDRLKDPGHPIRMKGTCKSFSVLRQEEDSGATNLVRDGCIRLPSVESHHDLSEAIDSRINVSGAPFLIVFE